jgi:hypothetical protein
MFEAEPDPVAALDRANARVGAAQLEMLRLIAAVDDRGDWEGDGARDLTHWLQMRYGLSLWKAHRWVSAARALEGLPVLSRALEVGELGLDKVVELARFATTRDEARLIRWARGVSCGAVRKRADRDAQPEVEVDREAHRQRSFRWWWIGDERRLGLEGELPAAEGMQVVAAIEQVAARIPEMPDEQGQFHRDRRRADALVALCSGQVASVPPVRPTVVIHAQADGLRRGSGGAELHHGPALHPETAKRLACNARIQTVVEDADREAISFGRTRRVPTAAQMRHVRYRDGGCVFPGCGTNAFTEVHHVRSWSRGGATDLDNLVLICSFHHRLVHEHAWWFTREGGRMRWFRPNGVPYRAGPSPGPSPGSVDEIQQGEQLLELAATG